MTILSTTRLLALTTAAALSLAACGGADSATGTPTSTEAMPKVAAPAGTQWSRTIARTADGFVMGNPDAPLKLVEFGSPTCSHCATFSQASHAEMQSEFIDSGRVSMEYRPFMLNPADLLLAQVMTCAGGTDRFFPLLENVYASQEELFAGLQGGGEAAQAAAALPEGQRFPAMAAAFKLDTFFAARGVPQAETNRCLAQTAQVNAWAERTSSNATEFEITGTPTFFLNGTMISASEEWPAVREKLRAAGAR